MAGKGILQEIGPATAENARYRLGYQLRLAERALQQAAEEKLRPLDLNVPQLTTLLFVDRFPEISMARLAMLATVSVQTMHRSVTTLVERGFLERSERPDDRKSFALALTGRGRQVLKKGEALFREVQDIGNAALSEEERAMLSKLLAKYEGAFRGG